MSVPLGNALLADIIILRAAILVKIQFFALKLTRMFLEGEITFH
jgi:hypothetical protein